MSHALQTELASRFVGSELITCVDEINRLAKEHGYDVNVIDPEFNTGNIDHDSRRINVRTDKDSIITSFTIG